MLWTFRFENGCIVRVLASSFEEAKTKVVDLGPPISDEVTTSKLIEVIEIDKCQQQIEFAEEILNRFEKVIKESLNDKNY